MILFRLQILNILLVRKGLLGLLLPLIALWNNLEGYFHFLREEYQRKKCLSPLRGSDFQKILKKSSHLLCFVFQISFQYLHNLLIVMIIPAFSYQDLEKIKYCLILNSIDINQFYLIIGNFLKVIHEFQILFSCFPFIRIK